VANENANTITCTSAHQPNPPQLGKAAKKRRFAPAISPSLMGAVPALLICDSTEVDFVVTGAAR
jgi:hypothetical protein